MTDSPKIRNNITGNRLVEAAIDEFNHSFFSANVESITKKAGVSHGTFYLYFKNKNDIFICILNKIIERTALYRYSKKEYGHWLNAQSLRDFEKPIIDFVQIFSVHSGLMKALVQGMLQSDALFDFYHSKSDQLAKVFQAHINSLRKKKFLQECQGDIMSKIMMTTLYMSIFIRSLGIIHCTPDELAKNIAYIFYAVLNFGRKLKPSIDKIKTVKEYSGSIFNKTRKKIIEVAKEEFAVLGYFDANIAGIAKKAGCSRSTVYRYFKSKDDILQDIYKEKVSFFSPIHRLDPTRFQDYIQSGYYIMNIFKHIGPLNRAFLQGSFYSDQLNENYRRTFNTFSEPAMRTIEKLKKVGKCRGIDSIIATQILLTASSYSAFLHYMGKIEGTEDDFVSNIATFLFNLLNYTP
jgi:AcrR family transcriptional regulator